MEPVTVDVICPCYEFNMEEELEPRPDTCLCGHLRNKHDGGGCTAHVTLRPRRTP